MADHVLAWVTKVGELGKTGSTEGYILDATGSFAVEVEEAGVELDCHYGTGIPPRTGLLVFDGFADCTFRSPEEPEWVGAWREPTIFELSKLRRGKPPFRQEGA